LKVVVLENPVAMRTPRIDPDPNGVQVRRKIPVNSGTASQTLPGMDLLYDFGSSGKCFAHSKSGTSVRPNIDCLMPLTGPRL